MPRRIWSILVLFTWLMLGSGTLAFAHNLQHAADDCSDAMPLRHDDSNCRLHAQLHTPALTPALAALPLAYELFSREVVFQSQRGRAAPRAHIHAVRGPPVK